MVAGSDYRNHELDGLRGLAALAVALGHCVTAVSGVEVWQKELVDLPSMPIGDVIARLGHVLFPADAAVVVFFVLSGYVLWGSLARSTGPALGMSLSFLIRRAYRLLPVSIASALILGFLIPGTALDIAKNALLLDYNLNGVLWSLQVEVLGSVLILAAFLATRFLRSWLIAPTFVLLVAAAFSCSNQILVLFLPTFIIGAGIHYLPRFWFRSRWLLATAYIVLIATDLVVGRGSLARSLTFVSAGFVVSALAVSRPRILALPSIQFMGLVSYPFYLVHGATALMARILMGWLDIVIENRFWDFTVLATISIGLAYSIAWFLHVAVESPGVAAGGEVCRRLNSRNLKPARTTPALITQFARSD